MKPGAPGAAETLFDIGEIEGGRTKVVEAPAGVGWVKIGKTVGTEAFEAMSDAG